MSAQGMMLSEIRKRKIEDKHSEFTDKLHTEKKIIKNDFLFICFGTTPRSPQGLLLAGSGNWGLNSSGPQIPYCVIAPASSIFFNGKKCKEFIASLQFNLILFSRTNFCGVKAGLMHSQNSQDHRSIIGRESGIATLVTHDQAVYQS